MTFSVTIPDEIALNLGENPGRMALELLAVELYRSDKLSKPELCELLGLDTWEEEQSFIGKHHLNDYTDQDLERDLNYIREYKTRSAAAA